jgi:hypothetical protein
VLDWLFEGRPAVYVSLAAVGFVMLVAWVQNRKRLWLIGVGTVVVLAGLYYLLDRAVETDREQVERKVEEMAAAVRPRNVEAILRNVSDRFNRGGRDKASFRQWVSAHIGLVEEVKVWDFGRPDDFLGTVPLPGEATPAETIRVTFLAKASGGMAMGGPANPCEARFIRDPDGQWRMLDFQVFNPVITNQPEAIPGL